jgi:hypothetical protein
LLINTAGLLLIFFIKRATDKTPEMVIDLVSLLP